MSTSFMRGNLRRDPDDGQGLREQKQPPRANVTRDKLAASHAKLEERFPDGLDLYAPVLEIMFQEMRGATGTLCGTLDEDKFRQALRGEKPMRLADFCRLATSLHPQAKAAVRSALKFIAAAAGERVPQATNVKDAALDYLDQSVAAASHAIRSTDGRMTSAEGIALIRRLEEVRLRAEELEHAVMQAIGGRRA